MEVVDGAAERAQGAQVVPEIHEGQADRVLIDAIVMLPVHPTTSEDWWCPTANPRDPREGGDGETLP
jgi:hypothetical protein